MLADAFLESSFLTSSIAGYVLAIVVPILFIACLIQAIRVRKMSWIVGAVLTGIPTIVLLGVVSIAASREMQRGFRSQELGFSENLTERQFSEVRGLHYDYALSFPDIASWEISGDLGELDKAFAYRGRLYCGVLVEKLGVGTPEVYEKLVKDILSKRMEKGCTYSATNPQTLDGKRWLSFETETSVMSSRLRYRHYLYADDECAIQLIFWSEAKAFTAAAKVFDKIASTFRMPKASLTKPADLEFSRVSGNKLKYSVALPVTRKAAKLDPYDMIFDCNGFCMGVVIEPQGFGNARTYQKSVAAAMQSEDAGVVCSEFSPITIDGAPWGTFEADSTEREVKLKYRIYVHSNNSRSIRLLFWSSEAQLARNKEVIEKVAASFEFPKNNGQ